MKGLHFVQIKDVLSARCRSGTQCRELRGGLNGCGERPKHNHAKVGFLQMIFEYIKPGFEDVDKCVQFAADDEYSGDEHSIRAQVS
jgi:hypothetical protein